ncbi:MAG: hypothetical protein EPO52_03275 [Herbiconiux sp.]|uniref:hypothetical protein n=1 Tax=Herbiconiux sp. TaxID=1871186 RepID=UPI0011F462CB|nr:hypothetical protein [Herbiconiux sp.]TAJ49309.1 MAG: hypothetical protein EPO52_03275 [Herbiconiux sp.]
MRMRTLALTALCVMLLSGCASKGGAGTGSGPVDSPSPTSTISPTPTVTPEPEPTSAGWSSEGAWDACYRAHLAEFPLAEGSSIDPFDDDDVTWDPTLDGYVVHLTGQVTENGSEVDATRVCLVQGDPNDPQVVVNPVME